MGRKADIMLPAVLMRISTGEILERENYPRIDMEPIVGMDPDLVYLLVYTPYPEPNYDSRIFKLNTIEEVTTDPHPDYSHLNQFRVTYTTTKREVDEIKVEVDNAECLCNEGIFLKPKQLKYLVMGMGAMNRARNGITITDREEEILSNIQSYAVKFAQAEDNALNMYDQIDENEEPDIDSGWPS